MTNAAFLNNISVHEDWKLFLSEEIVQLISQIESEISCNEFTPTAEKVLRFLELPLNSAKIIIVGQDPYPQSGVATGRSFEVGTLKSWNEPFRNISLKNILRALYKAYSGKVINYNHLKQKLDNEFPLLPPGKLFSHWEKQGVLLLNTSYTCEIQKPGSHQRIWHPFTSRLLSYINQRNPELTWFLWGNHALEATQNIVIKKRVISQHPMMCYEKNGRDNDFLYGKMNCFEPFIPEIDWTGYQLPYGLKSASSLF